MWSTQDVGKVGIGVGPIMASGDSFVARITGKGGHGAMPHQTVDSIVVAGHLLLALQTVVSRNVTPLESALVTVGKVDAGSAFYIIPGEVTLEGTVRAHNDEVRDLVEKRCRELAEKLPQAFGASGKFHYKRSFSVVRNDEDITAQVRRGTASIVGEKAILPFKTLESDDFAEILNRIPDVYFYIGARNEAIGAGYPHHHPKFNMDERALHIETRIMIAAIRQLLSKASSNKKRAFLAGLWYQQLL